MAKGGGNSAARKSAKKSKKRGNARTADMFENGLDISKRSCAECSCCVAKKAAGEARRWNAGEDTVLKRVVKEEGEKNWNGIAKRVSALTGIVRSDVQCQHRYAHCLKDGLVKGHWKNHEDRTILSTVLELGIQNVRWSSIAKDLPGRIGKQVRDRYINYLDPKLKKEPFTPEEDATQGAPGYLRQQMGMPRLTHGRAIGKCYKKPVAQAHYEQKEKGRKVATERTKTSERSPHQDWFEWLQYRCGTSSRL